MGFKVPELEVWNKDSTSNGINSAILNVDRKDLNGMVASNIGKSAGDLSKEETTRKNVVYPTKMAEIVDNVKSGDELTMALGTVNSYESKMDDLANEYSELMKSTKDSETLKQSWKLYEDTAKNIHRQYLTGMNGHAATKVLDQSFMEYLGEQREKYEHLVQENVNSDIFNGHSALSNKVIGRMKRYSGSPDVLLKYTGRAFKQAEEEADIKGIEDPEEQKKYAKAMILDNVELVMDKYITDGRYDDFRAYLDKTTEYFDKEDLEPLYATVNDSEMLESLIQNLDERNGEEWQQLYRTLPPRLKEYVNISIDNDNNKKENDKKRVKDQIRSTAQKELKDNGRLKLYVEVDGKMHKVRPEDYR